MGPALAHRSAHPARRQKTIVNGKRATSNGEARKRRYSNTTYGLPLESRFSKVEIYTASIRQTGPDIRQKLARTREAGGNRQHQGNYGGPFEPT